MTKLVVLTGGPGAGKTASLAIVRQVFGPRVYVVPEAASIVFGGGFPRGDAPQARACAQRVIFTMQRELERMAENAGARVVCCDRGTLDCLAYYPGSADELLRERGTSLEAEIARYAHVIHLRPPAEGRGYDHSNPLRIETPAESRAIDARLETAWSTHPRRTFVDSHPDFRDKVAAVLALVAEHVSPVREPVDGERRPVTDER